MKQELYSVVVAKALLLNLKHSLAKLSYLCSPIYLQVSLALPTMWGFIQRNVAAEASLGDEALS